MRRLTLSTKMLVAALPLVIAMGVLLTLSVRSDLADIDRAESGAELGSVWAPLVGALNAVEAEQENAGDTELRGATDDAIDQLRDAVVPLGAAEAAGDHITSGRSALSAARRNTDPETITPDLQIDVDPDEAYAQASRSLVAVGQLLPSEAGDPELGRQLLAVVKLAEAKLAADNIVLGIGQWQDEPSDLSSLAAARGDFAELTAVLGEFEVIAPDAWATEFREAGFGSALAGFRADLDRAVLAARSDQTATYDTTEFEGLIDGGVEFLATVSDSIVEGAEAEAATTRSATWRRIIIALGAAVLAGLLAWLISRSITKRIRAVAAGANQVTTEQLPALVEALRDPRGSASLPAAAPIASRGDDEVAELAAAFNSMQDTLTEVAHQQVEVLRRGVSDIFVTMARRTRSLIDRQLALLDEFESDVDDPDILSNYYQLDHMATRMRRNSESLLVLANAEPKRRRVKATEVDDVVRAAIGEIEDYQRIEIEALEPLHVRGNIVADVSHLLAELLDNATSFSPPDTLVRVGGRSTGEAYMIRIVDSGVGVGGERLHELNDLLCNPPVVGLSVESTLGMSVVSLLANKHGITVSMAPGNPGLVVDVVLPSALFGSPEPPPPTPLPEFKVPDSPAGLDMAPPAPVDDVVPSATLDQLAATGLGATPTLSTPPAVHDDDERPVATSDWREMSLNLAAFQSGMRSATGADDELDDHTDDRADTHTDTHNDDHTDVGDQFDGPDVGLDGVVDGVDSAAATLVAPTFQEPPSPRPPMPEPTSDLTTIDHLARALDATGRAAGDELPEPTGTNSSEFDIPPAPPLTTASQSQLPLTPDYARPAPTPAGNGSLMPNLPTRLPGDGPDGGPDRLAPVPMPNLASDAYLPTRGRADDAAPSEGDHAETQLEADSLRDRLRSFQAEFQSAIDTEAGAEPQTDRPDLGGDHR